MTITYGRLCELTQKHGFEMNEKLRELLRGVEDDAVLHSHTEMAGLRQMLDSANTRADNAALSNHLQDQLATSSAQALSDDRDVIEPLQEPVSIEKAMLAGRLARAEVSCNAVPKAAVFLVNIQVSGWGESKDYAEGFANGFNRAAKWMQSAMLSRAATVAEPVGDERAIAQDSAVMVAFGNYANDPSGGNMLRVVRAVSRAAQSGQRAGVPQHWLAKREEDGWIRFCRPDGWRQSITPHEPANSHAHTLYLLLDGLIAAAPTQQQGDKA